MKESKNKYNIFQPLLLGLALAVGMMLGVKLDEAPSHTKWIRKVDKDKSRTIGRVEEILRFIDSKYVDSLDQDRLISVATEAILNELDPYSAYVKYNSDSELSKELDGYQEGLGFKELVADGYSFVYKVFKNSSAELSGLRVGDKIVSFNGVPLNSDDGMFIKEEWFENSNIGATCQLGILRNFGKEELVINVDKSYSSFEEPTAGFRIDDRTVYIKIDQFSKTSYKRFMEHFEKMYEDKIVDNLIVDVRSNTGGYLKDVVNILNQFFDDKGKLLLKTINKYGKETVYNSTGRSFFPIKKIVVLINEESASASEILAGVIQDWDKGVVIGQASFGKGLVQEEFPLVNQDKIRLSVARYQFPTGRNIYNDSSSVGKYGDIEYKSKIERRILKSGKIIPDIKVEKIFVDNAMMIYYVDNILDSFMFKKIYTDNSFTDNYKSDSFGNTLFNEELLTNIYSIIHDHLNIKRSFADDEKKFIRTIAEANLLKHTKGINDYQQKINMLDNSLDQAIQYFKR